MGIIKGQIELRSQISAQEKRIELLEQENETYFKQNTAFKNELTEKKQKIMEYVSKYEQTGLECEFCYGTLQVEFQYCPKCGKRVERKSFGELNKGSVPRRPEDLFQYEDDRDCILITKYNGFADKRIVIPSTINGKRVIGIWNGVFDGCKDLEEVIISEGCEYIGNEAFCYCDKLKNVKLPKSLSEIGNYAFRYCCIEEIALPPNVTTLGRSAFEDNPLRKVILSDNLVYIGQSAFKSTLIEEIVIPEGVAIIDNSAFEDTKLTNIELPASLYNIKSNAFKIAGLESVVINASTEKIDKDAFGRERLGGRYNDPIIYCAAGSQALFFARDNRYKHSEIAKKTAGYNNTYFSYIGIKFKCGEVDLIKILDLYKAETWSWRIERNGCLCIEGGVSIDQLYIIDTMIKHCYEQQGRDLSTPDKCRKYYKIAIESWL